MGHDVYMIDSCKNKTLVCRLTFNFKDLSDKYGGIHHMHGKKGSDVAKIATHVITQLEKERIQMPNIDENNLPPNWTYGVMPDRTRMPEQERKGVYMWHMTNFKDLGTKNPTSRFYSDECGAGVPDSDDDDDSDDDNNGDGDVDDNDDNDDDDVKPLVSDRAVNAALRDASLKIRVAMASDHDQNRAAQLLEEAIADAQEAADAANAVVKLALSLRAKINSPSKHP